MKQDEIELSDNFFVEEKFVLSFESIRDTHCIRRSNVLFHNIDLRFSSRFSRRQVEAWS
jgi:hypothetical protein